MSRRRPQTYRLWIAHTQQWRGQHWNDVPPRARAWELAQEGCFTLPQAVAYLEGFNTQMLHEAKPYWAIATCVTRRYRHDLQPAQWVSSRRLLRLRRMESSCG